MKKLFALLLVGGLLSLTLGCPPATTPTAGPSTAKPMSPMTPMPPKGGASSEKAPGLPTEKEKGTTEKEKGGFGLPTEKEKGTTEKEKGPKGTTEKGTTEKEKKDNK